MERSLIDLAISFALVAACGVAANVLSAISMQGVDGAATQTTAADKPHEPPLHEAPHVTPLQGDG